jgi:hypothetical protein
MKYCKVAYTANLRQFKGAIDAEELRSRILGMDNMGIIPKFIINHRASQNFEKEDRVHDCTHLHDFSRKNRILPFISWKSIDPIRPRIV